MQVNVGEDEYRTGEMQDNTVSMQARRDAGQKSLPNRRDAVCPDRFGSVLWHKLQYPTPDIGCTWFFCILLRKNVTVVQKIWHYSIYSSVV